MAGRKPSSEPSAPPSPEVEAAAQTLMSFFNANTSQALSSTSNTMSLDNKATQQSAELHTLEHPRPQATSGPTLEKSTRLVIKLGGMIIGGRAVQKPKTISNTSTTRLTSDATATASEAERGIAERVITNPGRTVLVGRAESHLRQKRKVEVNYTRRALNLGGDGPSDAMDIDSNTGGGVANANSNRSEDDLPVRSNSRSMADNTRTPAPKPSMAPYHGAQTTTAQHFLQTTSNTETADDDARRAHLNMANDLARSVSAAHPIDYNDFAVIDGSESFAAAPSRPTYQPYNAAAVAAGAPPHTTFRAVYIHTSKCDICNKRNKSVLYRCNTCTKQFDRDCMERDPHHSTEGLDWTDHGAQSASKPRTNSGPRVRKGLAKDATVKKKVSAKGAAALEEQLDLLEQSKKKRGAQSISMTTDGAFDGDDAGLMGERRRAAHRFGGGGMLGGGGRSPQPGFKQLGASGGYVNPTGYRATQSAAPEVYFSVYDRDNKAKEAEAENERAAKKHKGPIRRGNGLGKRKAEEDDEVISDDEVPMATRASRRPTTTFDTGIQAQGRVPAGATLGQAAPPSASYQSPTRSSGSQGMRPEVTSFFAEIDRLRADYARVTDELASLETRVAKLKAEKGQIEQKIAKRMGN